jgi:SAM-dependent methyltransferase
MRWPLRQRQHGGRLPSLGQDYQDAHRRYVERLEADHELWLHTKPFSAPPRYELIECLRTFSHAVGSLDLGVRAQVIDVGCGPGWLSELLARCGYWVTGVDVSEDMVRIARERLEAIRQPIGAGMTPIAEFHAIPVLDLPWKGRFDAAILYDAMHHFDDEVETLRVIRRALVPGGRIFIHEGVRPEPGSEGEENLIAEMKEYGTLESPFEPGYLVEVVEKAGFKEVRRFAAVDELLDVAQSAEELERVAQRLGNPPMNTVVAVNPVKTQGPGEAFRARIRSKGRWQDAGDGRHLTLAVTVRNEGAAYWPAGTPPFPTGSVTIGPYVPEDSKRHELPRQPLPASLAHGDSVEVAVHVPRGEVEGRSHVAIDLVREGIAWFAEYGSTPLVVPADAD